LERNKQKDSNDIIKIAVPLLNEGTQASRYTLAKQIGENFFQVLAGEYYDPENEEWEFLPGSIVRCEIAIDFLRNKKHLRAVEIRNEDGSFTRSEIFPKK
jgi:hypothetical protein